MDRYTRVFGAMEAGPAAGQAQAPLDWFQLISHVIGGVALLNYSLSTISRALRTAFGSRLRDAIRRATRTRVRAFITGVITTALLSSATASSLLVLAFVESGDMNLAQSLGIGLGIGLGSTLNAHLLSLSLHRYAMAMVAFGYIGYSWGGGNKHVAGNLGEATFGLGLLFSSTAVISSALAPLKFYGPFAVFMATLHNPALALLVSASAAIAFSSSNTVIAVCLTLAQQGFLTSEGCCTLVLGANIGTSVTPVLAAIGKRREALRVAVAYLALKVLGIATLLPLLPRFVALVQWSTVAAQARAEDAAYDAMVDRGAVRADAKLEMAELLRSAGLRAVLPMQVALAHTYANAWMGLICMPFLDAFARYVNRWLPAEEDDLGSPTAAAFASTGGSASSTGVAAQQVLPGLARYKLKSSSTDVNWGSSGPSSSSSTAGSPPGGGAASSSGSYGATAVLHAVDGAGHSPGDLSARRAVGSSDVDEGVVDPNRRLFARRR